MLPKIVTGWQSDISEFVLTFGLNPVNVLSIDGDKLSIGDLRDWFGFCYNLTNSDDRYIILLANTDLLSVEAQNILLKPLEEKKDNVELYLVVKNINKILPTILSRCEVLVVKKNTLEAKYWQEVVKLWKGLPADIVSYCETFPIENIDIFLSEIVSRMKLEISSGATLKRIRIIDCFLETVRDISFGNVNRRMALENLLFRTWRMIKVHQ